VRARFFTPVQTGPEAHPASCTMGTGSFPGVKRPGPDADPSLPSSAVDKKGYSYTSTLAMGRTACTEHQRLYKGDLYLFTNSMKKQVSLDSPGVAKCILTDVSKVHTACIFMAT
jgi:hypothetical protein